VNRFVAVIILGLLGVAGATGASDATYRGQITTVQGGAGVADVTYQCMKRADNSYGWVQAWTAP